MFLQDFDAKMKKVEERTYFLALFPNAGWHKNNGIALKKMGKNMFFKTLQENNK